MFMVGYEKLIFRFTMIIEINGLPVKLLRKQVKHLNLRIQRDGGVQISVPLRMPVDRVHQFLKDKWQWIDTHRRRLQQKTPETSLTLMTGDKLYLLGQCLEINIQPTDKKPRVEIKNDIAYFIVKPNTTLEEKKILLSRWYRLQMQQILPELVKKWEAIIEVTAAIYKIKYMKTPCGSCQPLKKHITLNLRLIEKPPICLEYVLVHELVHLLEASHNQRFYALMTHYMPNWREVKKLLEG